MRFKYSKPSIDVSPESIELAKIDRPILEGQRKAASFLQKQPRRSHCLLCQSSLAQVTPFNHRGLDYFLCSHCHHIQSQHLPTPSYPTDTEGLSFADVYPKLNSEQYLFRQNRIYKPKLDWMIEALTADGMSLSELQAKSWFEFGVGAGYFLSAVKDQGIQHFNGVEMNSDLCGIANNYLGKPCVYHHEASLTGALAKYPADVYVAFFVLEHIQDAGEFFKQLAQSPVGTIFVFSVPVFSFATLLESAFAQHAGRNLDNALHIQLYTDDSIRYALMQAGFTITHQWLFGQDAGDLRRVLTIELQERYPEYLQSIMSEKLTHLLDPLQQSIDQAHFTDSRHIICRKMPT
jgi:2-polyprenyl-3-methyl-5-hydroxy-6-metoxy-1,4-benzoquinol methylase